MSGRTASTTTYWISISLIGLGVIFLLQNFGIFYLGDLWDFWPIILIGIGVANFIESDYKSYFGPGILVLFGALALLANLHFIYWDDIWDIIPALVLIAIGVRILSTHKKDGKVEMRNDEAVQNSFNAMAFFGGKEMNVQSEFLESGNITAMFGAADISLANASLDPKGAAIEVFVMFGGAEIAVPAHWNIVLKGLPIFGGFADERKVLRDVESDELQPTLVLRGFVMFGGISIKNAVVA